MCGLGRMGAALATALVEDGHDLTVWNRTPRALDGAQPRPTAAEAAQGARVVVVMVFDGPAAESVLLGPGGVTAGADSGTLVLNSTTLAPEQSRELARQVTEAGCRYLEAPVLGSVPAARSGALHVLTGGAEEDARDAEPLLRVFSHGGSHRHVGPVGSASALKLVANLGLGVAVAALRDAVHLGAGLGLARREVLDTLEQGMFGPLVRGKRERLDQDAYQDADFTLAALLKDLTLAAEAVEVPLPTVEAARRLTADAARRGSEDIAALGSTPR